jgi:FAD synthetase
MSELSEDPAERARKYIANFEKTLQHFTLVKADTALNHENIARVSDTIQRYLQDSRYHLENNKPATALVSIAYAEGLLDALRFLELAVANSKTV